MRKTKMKQKQQGDVLLQQLNGTPCGKQRIIPRHARGFVLAEGEATGHAHVIDSETNARLIEIGDRLILQLQEEAELKHEEHGPVTLEPGVWEVGIVEEYDYFAQMTRNVVD